MTLTTENNIISLKAAYNAIVKGESYTSPTASDPVFSKDTEIIASFNSPINKHIIGRLLTFQKTLLNITGAYSSLKSATPEGFRACFLMDMPESTIEERLLTYFASEEFPMLCANIAIDHVEFKEQSFFPKLR